MLPTFTSLNTDNPFSDAGSGTPLNTLSAGTSEPTAAFAGELRRSALQLKPDGLEQGGELPPGGNPLPVGLRDGEIPPEIAELPADELQTIFADLEDLARLSGRELNLTPIATAAQSRMLDNGAGLPADAESSTVDLREGWKGADAPVAPVLVDYSKELDLDQLKDFDADIELTDISLRADGSIPPEALDSRVKLPPGLGLPEARGPAVPIPADPSAIQRQAAGLTADGKATALAGAAGVSATTAATTATSTVPAEAVQQSLQDSKAVPVRPIAANVEEKLLETRTARSIEPVLPTAAREQSSDSVQKLRAPLLTSESVSRFESLGTLSEGLRQDTTALTRPATSPIQFASAAAQPNGLQNTTSLQAQLQTATTLTGTLGTSVSDPSWGDRVSERVVMMANNRLQNAELRLTPAELGPLRVKVSMEDGLANVSFVATHSATRDALEQAMPKLRAMLEEQGIDLGQSSVDEQSADSAFGNDSDSDDGSESHAASTDSNGQAQGQIDSSGTDSTVRTTRGLLDTFA